MPKKEISGGGGGDRAKNRWPQTKGYVARAQEITIWGRRGMSSLWLQIQSNHPRLRLHAGDLLSHPARKVIGPARTTRCGESMDPEGIFGLLEGLLQGRLERRGYQRVRRQAAHPRLLVAPIVCLCHHRIFLALYDALICDFPCRSSSLMRRLKILLTRRMVSMRFLGSASSSPPFVPCMSCAVACI